MRSQRIGAVVPADQLALELPGLPPLRLVDAVPRRPGRPPTAAAAKAAVPAPAAAAGERVWLIWEDDEVLGIYADPDTAAADCAALRRHAQRERLTVHYDWMAVPVFTNRRHQPSAAPDRGGAGGRGDRRIRVSAWSASNPAARGPSTSSGSDRPTAASAQADP